MPDDLAAHVLRIRNMIRDLQGLDPLPEGGEDERTADR